VKNKKLTIYQAKPEPFFMHFLLFIQGIGLFQSKSIFVPPCRVITLPVADVVKYSAGLTERLSGHTGREYMPGMFVDQERPT